MRILLTGGTGFLGSYIAQCAATKGYEVVVLARDPSRRGYLENVDPNRMVKVARLDADYSNISDLVAENLPDAVIHVAAKARGGESEIEIREYIDANVLFGSLLLQTMRTHGVGAFVNCGTSWQCAGDGTYSPFDFYAATKQSFEDVIRYFTDGGLKAITLRVFDTFGPYDRRKKVVELLIDATKNEAPLGMSPGAQSIDLVDARDVAEAFVVAATRAIGLAPGCNEVYGVSSGAAMPLREVAEIVARVTGLQPNINWGGRPYRPREIMMPCRTLSRLPGWAPRRTLENGVRDIISALK